MLKKLLLSIILFAPPLFSMAEQLKINDTAPKTYVVEKGDTLWDISGPGNSYASGLNFTNPGMHGIGKFGQFQTSG